MILVNVVRGALLGLFVSSLACGDAGSALDLPPLEGFRSMILAFEPLGASADLELLAFDLTRDDPIEFQALAGDGRANVYLLLYPWELAFEDLAPGALVEVADDGRPLPTASKTFRASVGEGAAREFVEGPISSLALDAVRIAERACRRFVARPRSINALGALRFAEGAPTEADTVLIGTDRDELINILVRGEAAPIPLDPGLDLWAADWAVSGFVAGKGGAIYEAENVEVRRYDAIPTRERIIALSSIGRRGLGVVTSSGAFWVKQGGPWARSELTLSAGAAGDCAAIEGIAEGRPYAGRSGSAFVLTHGEDGFSKVDLSVPGVCSAANDLGSTLGVVLGSTDGKLVELNGDAHAVLADTSKAAEIVDVAVIGRRAFAAFADGTIAQYVDGHGLCDSFDTGVRPLRSVEQMRDGELIAVGDQDGAGKIPWALIELE